MPLLKIEDFPEEKQAELLAIDKTITRPTEDVRDRVILDTFIVGGLSFVDSETVYEQYKSEISTMIFEAISRMQSGVLCDDHGSDPHGDVENLRIGVYDENDALVGVLYVGAIIETAILGTYEARFMPYFPSRSDADSATLTGDVISHLLNNEIKASPSAIRFSAMRYVITTADKTDDDKRSLEHHKHLIGRNDLSSKIGDTAVAIAGRSEVTLMKAMV